MTNIDATKGDHSKKQTRSVVQIAAAQQQKIDDVYRVDSVEVHLFALCDDGTLWVRRTGSDQWNQLPNVPQP